jgi:DNA-binding transcriptional MerR regulator
MTNESLLSIGDVVRKTGLTERALRFYEQQGLLKPVRTEAGRRVYGAGDLTVLHHITLLKRAGFSLARIRDLFAAPGFDGGAIIAAQIMALEAEKAMIDKAVTALHAARRSAARGRTIDVETLCTLIQYGEQKMQIEAFKALKAKLETPEEQAKWKAAKMKAAKGVAPDDDPDAYAAKWLDLGERIEAALPLDPASKKAQAFVAEWNALAQPFWAKIPEDMKADARMMMDGVASGAILNPTVNVEAWKFYQAAVKAGAK